MTKHHLLDISKVVVEKVLTKRKQKAEKYFVITSDEAFNAKMKKEEKRRDAERVKTEKKIQRENKKKVKAEEKLKKINEKLARKKESLNNQVKHINLRDVYLLHI